MMKLTKIYATLIAICFLTSLCLAQGAPPPPPGMSEKETKKWKKQQKNRKKEEKKSELPQTVVSGTPPFDIMEKPEKVALFFNDYLGKAIKFESVTIFRIEAVPRTNEEMYGLDVISDQDAYSRYVTPVSKLNFIMMNHVAREVAAEQEEFIKTFPSGKVGRIVNVYAEMKRGEDGSKIAYVWCIDFVTKGVGVTKRVGLCQ